MELYDLTRCPDLIVHLIIARCLSKHDYEEFNRIWRDDLQMRLARLSTRGERILVPNSGHDLPSESPEVIVSAVEKVMRDLGRKF